MNAPDQREVWCVNDMLSTCKGAKHVGGSEATDLASMEEGHPPPCAHARPPPPAPGKGIVRGGQGDKGEEPDTMSTGAGTEGEDTSPDPLRGLPHHLGRANVRSEDARPKGGEPCKTMSSKPCFWRATNLPFMRL